MKPAAPTVGEWALGSERAETPTRPGPAEEGEGAGARQPGSGSALLCIGDQISSSERSDDQSSGECASDRTSGSRPVDCSVP